MNKLFDSLLGGYRIQVERAEEAAQAATVVPSPAPPPIPLPAPPVDPVQERRRQACEEIERLAAEAEKDVLARRDEFAEAARTEARLDLEGFEFKCVRFGSFMTLSSARRANLLTREPRDFAIPREFATSLNIAGCGSIRLIEGHAADLGWTVLYGYSMRPNPGVSGSYYGSGQVDYELPGLHPEVRPLFPSTRTIGRRVHFQMPSNAKQEYDEDDGPVQSQYQIKFRTPNFPRFAQDDLLFFSGLDATLFVPFGQGARVLDIILKAT